MAVVPQKKVSRVRVGRRRAHSYASRIDRVAVEEPMEIRLEFPDAQGVREVPVSVTMRTPGDDFELAAGFLYTEGIVGHASAVQELRYCRNVDPQEYNVVTAVLGDPSSFDAQGLTRNFYVTSSCGVCGKGSLEAVEVLGCEPVPDGPFRVPVQKILELPGKLGESQAVFEQTGGIHAAALFDGEGRLEVIREDVGRHNAVDKVVGHRLLNGGLPPSDRGLVVSSRTSFEILQKAAMAAVPVVVAVGAPSSLAVDFARRFNMTLTGFTSGSGFNVYSGKERIVGLEEPCE